MLRLRPDDIVNPERRSGYDHVHFSNHQPGGTRKRPYEAIACSAPGLPNLDKSSGRKWRGPRRATALEAAQDYCDFINGIDVQKVPKLKSAGHKRIKTKAPRRISPKRAEANRLLAEAIADEARDRSGWVYAISDGTAVKIGESYDHPTNRMATLQTGNPRPLALLDSVEVPDRKTVERELHTKFHKWNVLGEWFIQRPAILKEFRRLRKEHK